MPNRRPAGETLPLIDLTESAAPTCPKQRVQREPLIDIAETAERLGVSVRHVRRLVNERRIPFVKWGHLLRFDPAEVDLFIERSRVPGRH
jgi:excisionase family DNA binding protein